MCIWIKRFCLVTVFLGLLALNILTLVSATAFSALSGLAELIPGLETHVTRIEKQRSTVRTKALKQRTAIRQLKQATLKRTRRLAAYQILEVSSSAVPILGTAAVIGGTLWELQQLCAGLNEMNEYLIDFELEEIDDEKSILEEVCTTGISVVDLSAI